MEFEDAIKEVKAGKEVKRKFYDIYVIMYLDSHKQLCFKDSGGHRITGSVVHNDLFADWCVVEDKPYNLSNKLKKMVDIEDNEQIVVHSCEVTDIQEFINEVKEMIGKKMSSPTLIQIEIDKLSGSRFK